MGNRETGVFKARFFRVSHACQSRVAAHIAAGGGGGRRRWVLFHLEARNSASGFPPQALLFVLLDLSHSDDFNKLLDLSQEEGRRGVDGRWQKTVKAFY